MIKLFVLAILFVVILCQQEKDDLCSTKITDKMEATFQCMLKNMDKSLLEKEVQCFEQNSLKVPSKMTDIAEVVCSKDPDMMTKFNATSTCLEKVANDNQAAYNASMENMEKNCK